MTGHQPAFWHAGILAKYLAAHAVAEKTGAAAAWCVPDQDVLDPGAVAWPVARRGGTGGRWERAEGRLLRWPESIEGAPAGRIGAGEAVDPEGMPEGLGELARAVQGERSATTASARVWGAHERVIADRLGLAGDGPAAFATAVARTQFFASLVQRMRSDPEACARSYNAAAGAEPDAGMRPLAVSGSGDRIELPLWRVGAGGRRVAVFAPDLDGLDAGDLLPRATLFTGILRLAGCDLFVHGTGGIGYDRVTERWLGGWLRDELGDTLPVSLAPAGAVTATVLLDLGVPDVTRSDLAHAVWRAHAARHNPVLLGDAPAQKEKDTLVGRIESAVGAERAPLFEALHGLLERVRTQRGMELDALEADAGRVRAALADRSLAHDRTWPWVLHDDATLARLRSEIAARVRAGVAV
jgi:hypothetical protein